ncbi:MAG: lytic transglycosylase domain-containing protein [Xanthobacteraceae bacterium]
MPRCRPKRITGSKANSWRAGSRCAFAKPRTAARHFARIRAFGIDNTTALARAGYWQGRAAEAAGQRNRARAYYAAAARHTTTYYGQLAGARIGMKDVALAEPPAMSAARRATLSQAEIVRAVDLLYRIGERRLVVTFIADLDRVDDAGALMLIAELARKHDHARAAVLMGKDAVARGLPLDHHAFPTYGLPRYKPIGPPVEPAIVYAIARQESAFHPLTVSSAKAMGLMQVTPAAGRFIARGRTACDTTGGDCSATKSTTCRWARPSWAAIFKPTTAPTSLPSPLTTPAAAG